MRKLAVALGLLVFVITGCAQFQTMTSKEPVQLVAKTENLGRYSFVVPANFKFKENYSFIFENNGDVRAYLIYMGKGSVAKLVDFFDKNMPKKGWNPDVSLVGKTAVLSYTKDNKLIIMKIEPHMGFTYLKVMLTTQ
ncbi:MAG TPA: hypothetical protein DEP48_00600 [Persephonella sp.]|nr:MULTISPECIES: hypothetical protein [Persephonella]HCB68836.1 hypothetical protein [Persephonella sp.]